jgi:FkbM family methyltransferase
MMPINAETEVVQISLDSATYCICLPNADTDYIQKFILEHKKPYELELLQSMSSLLSAEDLVIDIGANIGNHSLYLAANCGSKVIAFEPNASLIEAFAKSVELNQFKDLISIVPGALGAEEGHGEFRAHIPDNIGAQSIEVGEGDIKITRLDSIRIDGTISMMKIDVEGMELEVLKGSIETIKKYRPILYVESLKEDEFLSVERYLFGLNYVVLDTFNATPTHLFIHASNLSSEIYEKYSVKRTIEMGYKVPEQISYMRKMLNEANLKYREVNKGNEELKAKLELQAGKANEIEVTLVQEIQYLVERYDSNSLNLSQVLQELKKTSEEKLDFVQGISERIESSFLEQCVLLQMLEKKEKYVDDLELQIKALDEAYDEKHAENIENAQLLREKEQQIMLLRDDNNNMMEECKQQKVEQLKLFETLKEKEAELSLLERRNDNLEGEFNKLRKDLVDFNKRVNQIELEKLKAVRQVSELRGSIMFQLGYAIVSGFLSLKGFASLPVRLFDIANQSIRKLIGSRYSNTNAQVKIKRKKAKKVVQIADAPKLLSSFMLSRDYLPRRRSNLKVACVMDDFTYSSYESTCELKQLTPSGWESELKGFQPQLLFIESAWRGKDELWGNKVGHNSSELKSIVAWCKKYHVPTIFWNKEDPVHYQTFLNVAKQFDYVFTTDLDCVSRYKTALKHNNVYFLPFACQPLTHNPIEKFERKEAISFAGAYYAQYPERSADLASFIETLPDTIPLDIYDRNFGQNDPKYMFPERYRKYIVGTLPFSEIDIAYKGYKYAINLNSVKQSQTMFARRLYELLASNTLTISNYSRGIRLMFGDLVACSDSGEVVRKTLSDWLKDVDSIDKLRLAGLRKVLSEHTYKHRLDYIQQKVFGEKYVSNEKLNVAVIGFVNSATQARNLVEKFELQLWKNKKLYIVVRDSSDEIKFPLREDIDFVDYDAYVKQPITEITEGASYIAAFSLDDFYAPHYLTDLLLSTTYIDVDVIGKGTWYCLSSNEGLTTKNKGNCYSVTKALSPYRSIVQADALKLFTLKNWRKQMKHRFDNQYSQYSADRFNYCENGHNETNSIDHVISDLNNLDIGESVRNLQSLSENAAAEASDVTERLFPHDTLADVFKKKQTTNLSLSFSGELVRIESKLDDGKHEYIYAQDLLELEYFNPTRSQNEHYLKLFVESTPGLSVSFVVIFFDEHKQRLGHQIIQTNKNKALPIPNATLFVRIGFRVLSSGNCEIRDIVLGERSFLPSSIVSASKTLLVTNHYPSYQQLYRNSFVHSRVKAYKKLNVYVDVFRLWPDSNISYHEFEGVDITTGSSDVLNKKIKDGDYKSVLVHFLDENMWGVLKNLPANVKIYVWVHGAEVQPWWRREYNYNNERDLEIAKKQSDLRMAFWRSVLSPLPSNLHFIFVSQYFADEVMEDMQINLPKEQYEIIHNPIDTQVFKYVEKPIEQRKKILSIRPYASTKYANDLSVEVVLMLSKKSWFKELEFRFIGDGKLFDEVLAPILGFDNVVIERKFLRHEEIAEIHKSYGVFLCPTRMDAQGVSKDEAMASGLVPISNAVTAIPEFIDENCGILAAGESVEQMAAGIEMLYFKAEKFKILSANAARRVAVQTASELIIDKEIKTFHCVKSS